MRTQTLRQLELLLGGFQVASVEQRARSIESDLEAVVRRGTQRLLIIDFTLIDYYNVIGTNSPGNKKITWPSQII